MYPEVICLATAWLFTTGIRRGELLALGPIFGDRIATAILLLGASMAYTRT